MLRQLRRVPAAGDRPRRGRPGRAGPIGAITRTGGSRRLSHDGHPLYSYICDSAPGLARGNNLNLHGGPWHEVRVSR
jgi:predicted lipoprotein with Yx(FWY)xxD motif